MSRPTNKEYRAAILGAFDTHMHRTLREVNEYLKENESGRFFVNEQSSRRMLNRMVTEGLLIELGRGEKNAIVYTKAVFTQFAQFKTIDGDIVGLGAFINHVAHLDSKFMNREVLNMIKGLLLDTLASAYPDPYVRRNLSPVASALTRRELNSLLSVLSQWHSFIRNFLDAKIWDDFGKENLAKQFKNDLAVQHAAILEKTWKQDKQDG